MDLKMKTSLAIFILAAITSSISVIASLASAPTYGMLFIIGIVTSLAAIGCVAYLYYFADFVWFLAGIVPGVVAVYVISDVMLRRFAGFRVFDMFN